MLSACIEPRLRRPLGPLHLLSYLSANVRNTWDAEHRAPHVCTQSAEHSRYRRERRAIDTGAKARVRFPARDETPWWKRDVTALGSRSPIKIRGKSAATRIPGIQRLQRLNLKFENFDIPRGIFRPKDWKACSRERPRTLRDVPEGESPNSLKELSRKRWEGKLRESKVG